MGRSDFDQIIGEMSVAVGKLWQWHFSDFAAGDSWAPDVNIYRLPKKLVMCMDLAGMNKDSIEVHVEAGHLTIRGFRQAPEPRGVSCQTLRILCMEINHGPFARYIALPEQVDLAKVESTYEQGWLWINLPLREPG